MKTLTKNLNIISLIILLTITTLIVYNTVTYGVVNYVSFNGI